MCTLFSEGLGFLQQRRTDSYFLSRKIFPCGEDPNKCAYRRVHVFSIWDSLEFTQGMGCHVALISGTLMPMCLESVHYGIIRPVWNHLSSEGFIFLFMPKNPILQYRCLWQACLNVSIYLIFILFSANFANLDFVLKVCLIRLIGSLNGPLGEQSKCQSSLRLGLNGPQRDSSKYLQTVCGLIGHLLSASFVVKQNKTFKKECKIHSSYWGPTHLLHCPANFSIISFH